MNILHLDASASKHAQSHTRRLSAELVMHMKKTPGKYNVVYHDLADLKLPHIDTTIQAAWADESERDASLDELANRSKNLVTELQAADAVIIGSPMYNFTVPSTLKAWIDHVAIAGQTFRYTDNGPQGLLENKKAYLALSSGGIYSEGPAMQFDHLDTYLRTVLAFMGITDVTTIRAEGVVFGPEQDEAAMQQALAKIQAL